MSRQIEPTSNYQERILKLIPGEIVAAYLALDGIAEARPTSQFYFLVAAICVLLVINYFYLLKLHQVTSRLQIIFTEISFIVWVFGLGGPFLHFLWYDRTWGSGLVICWTLLIPLIPFSSDKEYYQ